MARGGQNRRRFPSWVARQYSALNQEPIGARGVDYPVPVLWRCTCGCHVYKSRHAVSNNLRRHNPCPATCFECPMHGYRQHASAPARLAFALLCSIAAGLLFPCTVVWEARVVHGFGAFDFWLLQWAVLVEVDGDQHTEGSYCGTDAAEQAVRDRAKEVAALAHGFHVVRLHVRDWLWWQATVRNAMLEAAQGMPPRLHVTPSYPQLHPLHHGLT